MDSQTTQTVLTLVVIAFAFVVLILDRLKNLFPSQKYYSPSDSANLRQDLENTRQELEDTRDELRQVREERNRAQREAVNSANQAAYFENAFEDIRQQLERANELAHRQQDIINQLTRQLSEVQAQFRAQATTTVNVTNRQGGVDMQADKIEVGQDVVGNDKK